MGVGWEGSGVVEAPKHPESALKGAVKWEQQLSRGGDEVQLVLECSPAHGQHLKPVSPQARVGDNVTSSGKRGCFVGERGGGPSCGEI